MNANIYLKDFSNCFHYLTDVSLDINKSRWVGGDKSCVQIEDPGRRDENESICCVLLIDTHPDEAYRDVYNAGDVITCYEGDE